jgi:hypothetical protein
MMLQRGNISSRSEAHHHIFKLRWLGLELLGLGLGADENTSSSVGMRTGSERGSRNRGHGNRASERTNLRAYSLEVQPFLYL